MYSHNKLWYIPDLSLNVIIGRHICMNIVIIIRCKKQRHCETSIMLSMLQKKLDVVFFHISVSISNYIVVYFPDTYMKKNMIVALLWKENLHRQFDSLYKWFPICFFNNVLSMGVGDFLLWYRQSKWIFEAAHNYWLFAMFTMSHADQVMIIICERHTILGLEYFFLNVFVNTLRRYHLHGTIGITCMSHHATAISSIMSHHATAISSIAVEHW